jgi:hypothetical protein
MLLSLKRSRVMEMIRHNLNFAAAAIFAPSSRQRLLDEDDQGLNA